MLEFIFSDSFSLFDLAVILCTSSLMASKRYWVGAVLLIVGGVLSGLIQTAWQMGVM